MNAYTTVLLYAGWILVLALFYATPRIPQALLGQKRIDSWERGKEPIDPMMLQRAKSAHLNCLENFPVFAAIVAIAGLMGQIDAINGIAAFVLYARIAQSVVHITGTSFIQVFLRANFFLAQVGLMLYMVYLLVS
ncbi:MAG: MAPEG family protein [Gammaproteobacteria bacterium]|uniref:MAPEG family protein n=1 Tax=Limnobacter sp. TaxID=2003368 RepID=UPI001D8CE6F3|nr:MAPEG family protein [Limnobacter sp.]MBU0784610.1 MAPEG family protein [Gammaproteobacteria bacterium]MBU0847995.1 MAPEG family protein [Gammaproteobacteria bacterium]MBU1268885.1 MAPEG family protein [Gammaproteobacteria bacterium]MBU1529781.1 MAPEG family protein [Gammaproteobacteria bacterium]MBU1779968.1 MAPEG family protein [Gammaproteobacteria bacterium]